MTITIDFWLFLEEILVFFSDVYSTQVAFNTVFIYGLNQDFFLLVRKNTHHVCYTRWTQQEAARQEGCRAWAEGGAWCWVWVMNGRGSLPRQDRPQLLTETLSYLQTAGFYL